MEIKCQEFVAACSKKLFRKLSGEVQKNHEQHKVGITGLKAVFGRGNFRVKELQHSVLDTTVGAKVICFCRLYMHIMLLFYWELR